MGAKKQKPKGVLRQKREDMPGQKRKGVLTVEAAIILPIFIMVMFFVLSMLKLFYFHLVMQQALQNVGRTLAQYGYVIDELVGLDQFALQEETKATEKNLTDKVSAVIDGGSELVSLLQGGIKLDTIGEIINQGKSFKEDLDDLGSFLSDLKENENKGEMIINYLLVSAMNEAGGSFVQWMIGDYLDEMQAMNASFDKLRYQLYVDAGSANSGNADGGTDDGSNTDSANAVIGSKDLLFVVDYDFNLPFFFFNKLRLRQSVRVHPWVGGPTEGVVWEE